MFNLITRSNELFDHIFYDTDALSAPEKCCLSPMDHREGSILVVSPGNAGVHIRKYADATEFLNNDEGNVRALVVAGVGSSAIGTAALARSIANIYGIEVVGVVSGYGTADFLSEAMGGWFFFGAADALRHPMRNVFDNLESAMRLNPFYRLAREAIERVDDKVEADAVTVLELLSSEKLDLRLVVGHSKGSLVLDHALEKFSVLFESPGHRYFDSLNIVSLGTVTNFPPKFRNIFQFIGAMDWLGGLNSRLGVPHTLVPRAGHHLNTSVPFHIPLQSVLRAHLPLDTEQPVTE